MIRLDANYTLGIQLNELMKRDDLIESLKRVGNDVFFRIVGGGLIQIVSEDMDVIGMREWIQVDDEGRVINGDIYKYLNN